MPCRPLDRTAPARRARAWRTILVATVMATVVVASACEPGTDQSAAPSTTVGADGTASPPTTLVDPTPTPSPPGLTTAASDPDPSPAPTAASTLPGATVVTGGTAVAQPRDPGDGPSIRSVDFADLTYPTSVCADIIPTPPQGGIQLRDGEVHAGEDAANGPYSVTLRPPRSFGDVNGDGHEDAALVLECSRGGQPVPVGWIYTVDDSGPRPLAGVSLDPDALPTTGVLDTALTNVRISGTDVVTNWDVYVDGDALCCPTKTAVVIWSWTDGGLTPGAPTLTRAAAGS